MQWNRMAGLVVGVLAAANALLVQGGDSDRIRTQQAKTEASSNLEGRWIVDSGTVDGDAQDMKGDKAHFAKGKFTLDEQNGDVQRGTYKEDTTKKPNHIDFTPTEGRQKGEVFKGIFIRDGNRLTLCLARPSDDRPTEASSKEGSGRILMVFDLAKPE